MSGVEVVEVAPECARLARELRGLRARTGLSMAALAARTPYSKSSWERYLNGKALPPRHAVRALCGVAGEPLARYLALWELAESAWSGRGRASGEVVGPSGGVEGRWLGWVVLVGVVCGAVGMVVGVLLASGLGVGCYGS